MVIKKSTATWLAVSMLFVGLCSGFIGGCTYTVGQFTGRLDASGARIVELEQINSNVNQRISELEATIGRAKEIADSATRSGETALQSLRRAIETLTKLKEILRSQ